ncbi:uncharacterized protein LOC134663570 [Cydia fagiglandana]|uniref:uncharacterized protein LOC134663570 n=1 Tax=Cydia fagiglandana TaxID=1458189 RepID=UPI002FEDF49F
MLASPLCVFIVLANILILCLSFPGKILGPGIPIFRKLEPCNPPTSDIDISVTQRKFNRSTNVFDVSIITPWPLGENIILELSASIKKEGGYKPGYYYLKDTFCAIIKTVFNDVFQSFLEAIEVESCPIPNGTHKVKDFFLDNQEMPKDVLYGEYKADAKLYRNEVLVGCNVVYMDFEPKD